MASRSLSTEWQDINYFYKTLIIDDIRCLYSLFIIILFHLTSLAIRTISSLTNMQFKGKGSMIRIIRCLQRWCERPLAARKGHVRKFRGFCSIRPLAHILCFFFSLILVHWDSIEWFTSNAVDRCGVLIWRNSNFSSAVFFFFGTYFVRCGRAKSGRYVRTRYVGRRVISWKWPPQSIMEFH